MKTPKGKGTLLYPIRRTQRQEWYVLIGTKGYSFRVEEMEEWQDESQSQNSDA